MTITSINALQKLLLQIRTDKRYKENVLYGTPRRGHDEGTIAAHIAQLEVNCDKMRDDKTINDLQYVKLLILTHVHDTFKAETAARGKKNCAIEDPDSHASIARAYLAELCNDEDLLNIVQYHDLGYAVYRNFKDRGYVNEERIEAGLSKIQDLNLFMLFCVVDTCTPSKGREMLGWWIDEVRKRRPGVWVSKDHIIPGPETVGDVW